MRLSELLEGERPTPDADIEIRGLASDSREVRPGYLFAALAGTRMDGAAFVGDAVARGAAAVLAAPEADVGAAGVAVLRDGNPRRRLARMAASFYARQPRTIAAVTGTNGKTSVAEFARQLWHGLGHRAASLGTLGVRGADGDRKLPHTTPEPVTLHRILAELAEAGVDHLAIEASSHGLDQYRLDGVRVGAAAFTNLYRDHLDYHDTAEAYLRAKLRLFDVVMEPGGTAVLNVDAPEFERLRGICRRRGHRIITYGLGAADLRLAACRATASAQRLELEVDGATHHAEIALVGDFQALNVVCALGLVVACGDEAGRALALLDRLQGVPGRLELAARHPSGAPAFVDYSHKPEALGHALAALRPYATGRLRVVFGCGGDRDAGKRPIMGRVAAELADEVIVTDDNPRSEDAAAIRRAVLEGCPGALEIGDRAAAIRAGLDGLETGDLLLVAGKGHERVQITGDRECPFDDGEQLRAAVAEIAEAGR